MDSKSIQLHEIMITRGTFFCYAGPLSETVLTSISSGVKCQLADTGNTVSVINKVFGIFVEQAQNIIRYSCERIDGGGVGSVSISSTDSGFKIEAINEISQADRLRVGEALEKLQAMDGTQLKQAYKERIKSAPPEGSLGAGLGFIEVARRSSRFDFSFEEHDGTTLFLYRGWVDLPTG